MEFLQFCTQRNSLRCVDWLQRLKLEINCLSSKEKRKKEDQIGHISTLKLSSSCSLQRYTFNCGVLFGLYKNYKEETKGF